jgi:hypothetical protein
MKLALKIAACAALLTVAAGCGREKNSDGLTSEQRQRLNEISANLDGDVVDTSPDSLTVANSEWDAAENGEAPSGNAAAPTPNASARNGQ